MSELGKWIYNIEAFITSHQNYLLSVFGVICVNGFRGNRK